MMHSNKNDLPSSVETTPALGAVVLKPVAAMGFTLVEMVVAVSIMVTFLAATSTAFLYLLKHETITSTQASLDVDVRRASERIKNHMRLSALNMMVFYPGNAPQHQSVSFPLPGDSAGDGSVDLDEDGRIDWQSTIVYHPWPLNAPRELRLTTFSPRNNHLTDEQRLEQLTSVSLDGDGLNAHNGTNAVTQTIFRNLFNWNIRPLEAQYEGYAPMKRRDRNVTLGSFVLEPGAHEITFTTRGKDPDASSFHARLDTLHLTPSMLPLEAEDMPVEAYTGPQPIRFYEANGYWSGNHQLFFPATEVGQSMTLSFENDAWIKSHFMEVGDLLNDMQLVFDKTVTPHHYVLRLNGMRSLWSTIDQTLDPTGQSGATGMLGDRSVRVMMRGLDAGGTGFLSWQAKGGRVVFRRGANGYLYIRLANIAEAADHVDPTFSINTATIQNLTFNGNTAVWVTTGAGVESDNLANPFDPHKTYIVSYRLSSVLGSTPHIWTADESQNAHNATIVLPTANSSDAILSDADWPDAGIRTVDIYGVESLIGTYVPEGFYESAIADTRVADASFYEFAWESLTPSGTAIEMKLRAGNQPDLSDAPAWSNVTALSVSPELMNLPQGRYAQVQARMTSNAGGLNSPELESFVLKWPGNTRIVDIGGTFTQAPDQGRFDVTINGVSLKTGVIVDLEIFRDVRGLMMTGHQRLRSSLATEVTPRNTRDDDI